jgi:5'-3' exonuclease
MGIKGLMAVAKAAGAVTAEVDLAGAIGVDASVYLYKWLHVGMSRNIVDGEGMHINHLIGAFYRAAKILLAGGRVVFVFDGQPGKLKDRTLLQRKIAAIASAEATNKPRLHPHSYTQELVQMLGLMGVECVKATGESDMVLRDLYRAGEIAAVMTTDTDLLAMNVPIIKGCLLYTSPSPRDH